MHRRMLTMVPRGIHGHCGKETERGWEMEMEGGVRGDGKIIISLSCLETFEKGKRNKMRFQKKKGGDFVKKNSQT